MSDMTGIRELTLILEKLYNALYGIKSKARGDILDRISSTSDPATISEVSVQTVLAERKTYVWGPGSPQLVWDESAWS
jgi:hypothetical protein